MWNTKTHLSPYKFRGGTLPWLLREEKNSIIKTSMEEKALEEEKQTRTYDRPRQHPSVILSGPLGKICHKLFYESSTMRHHIVSCHKRNQLDLWLCLRCYLYDPPSFPHLTIGAEPLRLTCFLNSQSCSVSSKTLRRSESFSDRLWEISAWAASLAL